MTCPCNGIYKDFAKTTLCIECVILAANCSTKSYEASRFVNQLAEKGCTSNLRSQDFIMHSIFQARFAVILDLHGRELILAGQL